MTKEDVLQKCKINGTTIQLPTGQLDRKLYMEVAKSLELIGGKWKGGKVAGFVFPNDPTELLEQIATGEKRNLKKEFQFFSTPNELCDTLVELTDIHASHSVLEPSAGQGAIINAIYRGSMLRQIDCCELMDVNRIFLSKIKNVRIIQNDFLMLKNHENSFDRIIANPPFSKNQDIDHIMKMWECLKPKGRIVSIASRHWLQSSNKKEVAFRKFLEDNQAEIIDVDAGKFKESGTSIATVIIVLNK